MRRSALLATIALCLTAAVGFPALPPAVAQDATPVASPSPGTATALFADVTDASLPMPQPCGPRSNEGCYSNYVRLADLDNDGDLDVVFANGGDYFSPGGDSGLQPLVVYRNDGPGADGAPRFTDASAEAVGGFRSRLRQVAIGDVDGDGNLDLYAPGSWGETDALFINDGRGAFTDEAAQRMPAGLASRAGATRFGDVDGDSDLDLVVTDWGEAPPGSTGTAKLYLNDGSGRFTAASNRLPPAADPTLGTAPVDVDFADVDGDFDLDLLLNNRDGGNLLWLNDGTGMFIDATTDQLPTKPSAMSYDVEPCDVDGDADLDLWIDNARLARAEQLLINDGQGVFADESEARITGNPPGDDNEITCADIDGDGDFDAVITALEGNERVLINDGTGQFTAMLYGFPLRADPSLSMEVGDLDGDAILDAVTAQGESTPKLNRVYQGIAPAPADTRAPVLRAGPALATQPDGSVGITFALADNVTTDGGPRLATEGVTVEWQAGGGEVKQTPATFLGGDLFRAVLPAGTAGADLLVSISAVDQAGNTLRTLRAPLLGVSPRASTPPVGTPAA
jgi:hypothetical protein